MGQGGQGWIGREGLCCFVPPLFLVNTLFLDNFCFFGFFFVFVFCDL